MTDNKDWHENSIDSILYTSIVVRIDLNHADWGGHAYFWLDE
jgi:hypothetical protein